MRAEDIENVKVEDNVQWPYYVTSLYITWAIPVPVMEIYSTTSCVVDYRPLLPPFCCFHNFPNFAIYILRKRAEGNWAFRLPDPKTHAGRRFGVRSSTASYRLSQSERVTPLLLFMNFETNCKKNSIRTDRTEYIVDLNYFVKLFCPDQYLRATGRTRFATSATRGGQICWSKVVGR
jgi:hypothetical protein